MKKEFLDNIKAVRQRIKNGQVDDRMNALKWISLLQLTEQTNKGLFYKDHFFAIIDYDETAADFLKKYDLFPENVYEEEIPVSQFGYCYIICYDLPNYIGIPLYAIKAPDFNFAELSDEAQKKALSHLMQICKIQDELTFGDGIDIV